MRTLFVAVLVGTLMLACAGCKPSTPGFSAGRSTDTPPILRPGTYSIAASSLRVRSEATASASVLGSIPRGALVSVHQHQSGAHQAIDGASGYWVPVVGGFAFSAYLAPNPASPELFGFSPSGAGCHLQGTVLRCKTAALSQKEYLLPPGTLLVYRLDGGCINKALQVLSVQAATAGVPTVAGNAWVDDWTVFLETEARPLQVTVHRSPYECPG